MPTVQPLRAKLHLLLAAILVIAGVRNCADAQTDRPLLVDESFRTYQRGSDGSPVWTAVKGEWQVIDSTYVQQSPDYDCASLLDIFLNESYRFEAEFELLDGDPGVGFVFSSRERTSTAYSQVARFDGGTTFLSGYFQSGAFNATSSGRSPALRPRTRHLLALEVNRDAETFSVSLDGQILQGNQPLLYPAGYAGLQSSGGRIRFSHVTLRRLPMKKRPAALHWLQHVLAAGDGTFLVPDEQAGTVAVVDSLGAVRRTIGTAASERGQLHRPDAVALGGDSLIIADRGSNQLHLFLSDGRWVASFGWKGRGSGEFDEPAALAVNDRHQLFVVDKNNNRIQVLDFGFHMVSEFGADRLIRPNDVALDGANLFVLNAGLCQVEWYRWDGARAVWKASIGYGGGEGNGIAARAGRIYLSVVNEVRCYDTTGVLLHRLRGRSIDFLLPRGIALGRGDRVYIADFFHGRIVRTDSTLLDPSPALRLTPSGRAFIEWPSLETSAGWAEVQSLRRTTTRCAEGGKTRNHRVELPDLRGNEVLHCSVSPTLPTIPPRAVPSRSYPLAITIARKTALHARLPLAAIIFTHVIDDRASAPPPPPSAPLPDPDTGRIRRQLADAVRFYWVHSGMRLFLDLTTFLVNDTLRRSQLYGPEWWYPPRDSVLEHYLAVNGRSARDFSGILFLTCTQSFDTVGQQFVLAGKGGAFTNGVGTGKGYGISWWDVTKPNHNAGNNWLMVHEFNHQLDDIFASSGYPEYWFNHISPTIGTAADFGEHFDANRFILRMVPRDEWLDLRYTSISESRDNDEDGIPDNDPSLPLDEVRLGSDSTSADSDGDGIPDLEELTFSNWVEEGWGESANSEMRLPNLRSKDTDGDGLADGVDPYPCAALRTGIVFKTPTLIGSMHDPRCSAALRAWWDDDSLYFETELDRSLPVKLMIDAQSDGWFLGRDNILLTAAPAGDSLRVKPQILNCTDPEQWPYIDTLLQAQLRLSAVVYHRAGAFLYRIALQRNAFLGLTLRPRMPIGVLFGVLCPFDAQGDQRYVDLYEPHRFFKVTLTK